MKVMHEPDRRTDEHLNTSEDKERHTPGLQMFEIKKDTTDQEPESKQDVIDGIKNIVGFFKEDIMFPYMEIDVFLLV